MPDFKTIADFRKDNGKAIRSVCSQFIELCRQMNLFSKAVVAIDGSRFKAVNSRDKNFTPAKMKRRMSEVEKCIARSLHQLDEADQDDAVVSEGKVTHLQEKLAFLKDRLKELKALEEKMLQAPDKQLSLTDPDSRAMATSSKISGIVGYNVQTAVDTENHLIVAHEVTNQGHGRAQLLNMSQKARSAMNVENLTAIADRGYYKGEEILACHNAGITAYLPKPLTSPSHSKGRFSKEDFRYIPEDDEYQCPAGERLEYRMTVEEDGKVLHAYWRSGCKSCPIKNHCTPNNERRVKRWEYEEILDELQDRMEETPKVMQLRKETVEHPFGTIKAWMGWTHFLTKTFPRVKTEMSLHVLAYNMKRVMNIMGSSALIEAMRT